eukprot:m.161288 g.161288  ORF g.161288 m.161288 type:complete len:1191 (-) comp16523_c0_seq1:1-3573(-)
MAYSALTKLFMLMAAMAMLFLTVQLYLTQAHASTAETEHSHPQMEHRVRVDRSNEGVAEKKLAMPTVKQAIPAVAVGGYGNVDAVVDSGVDKNFHVPPLPTKHKHNEAHGHEMKEALHDKFRHGAQALYPDDMDSLKEKLRRKQEDSAPPKVIAMKAFDGEAAKALSWNADPHNVAYERDAKDIAKRSKTISSTSAATEAPTDFKVKEIHDGIHFEDMSRGWHPKNVKYDKTQWKKRTLQVVLMPHTHVDPGWIKTLDRYYEEQTRHILDVVVDYLNEAPYRKFIWAEISFLSMWWDRADDNHRKALKRVVQSGQFEIVTGGWVMTDEASSHVYAMVDQLIEGQRWVNRTLGVVPRSGWSIDPFGQSATMAFINNRAGIKSMIIDRIHWRLKQFMQRNKQLVFRWRQHWDHVGASDVMTHVLPFYLYDVHYSCGPDYATCCKLDFGMRFFLKTSSQCGEFGQSRQVNPVTSSTVRELSKDLLHEYRKVAQLFNHDVVLHPIGGDFRYVNHDEIHAMLDSYAKMMQHLNNDPDADVEVRFGTLRDYFELLEQRAPDSTFSTLAGDFMPYNDRKDHYWSGFYSTRPMYKRMSRVLETQLRAADIFNSLAMVEATHASEFLDQHLPKLSSARRELGLFQHHDAMTGTCKAHVSKDYGERLMRGYRHATVVHSSSVHTLLQRSNPGVEIAVTILLNMDRYDRLPQPVALSLEGTTVVAVANSLAQRMKAPIRLRVATPSVSVRDHTSGSQVTAQVTPVFKMDGSVTDTYDLWFEAELDGLSVALFDIKASDGSNGVTIVSELTRSLPKFDSEKRNAGDAIELTNDHVVLKFDGTKGTLSDIELKGSNTKWHLTLDFANYKSKTGSDSHSGAYLFIPAGNAARYSSSTTPIVTVIKGPYVQEVHLFLAHIHHTVRLFNSVEGYGKAPFIDNIVHINNAKDGATPLKDADFVMRVTSSVSTGKYFFSDANGFQTQRRHRRETMGVAGNYMPLSSHIFVQSSDARLTWLTDSPLGGTSTGSGQMEIMLDRTHARDDNLGMGEGITDSVRYRQQSVLLLEKQSGSDDTSDNHIFELSLLAHSLYDVLQGPTVPFKVTAATKLKPFQLPKLSLPRSFHLLTLRTDKTLTAQHQTQLVLFKRGFDCEEATCQAETSADLRGLLSHFSVDKLQATALSGVVKLEGASDGVIANAGSYDIQS